MAALSPSSPFWFCTSEPEEPEVPQALLLPNNQRTGIIIAVSTSITRCFVSKRVKMLHTPARIVQAPYRKHPSRMHLPNPRRMGRIRRIDRIKGTFTEKTPLRDQSKKKVDQLHVAGNSTQSSQFPTQRGQLSSCPPAQSLSPSLSKQNRPLAELNSPIELLRTV